MKELFYQMVTEDPDTVADIRKALKEKVFNLLNISKGFTKITEGIDRNYNGGSVRPLESYFINSKTREIYKIDDVWAHTKAIAKDATRGGKRFGVSRKNFIDAMDKSKYSSISDYITNSTHHYDVDILRLAAKNNWTRVNIMNHGHVDIQAQTVSEIRVVLDVLNKTMVIQNAIIEDYDDSGESYSLKNHQEVQTFINTGKYVRSQISDFR